MDFGLRLLSVLSIPITLFFFFLMARMSNKMLPARKRIYLMGIIMPMLMLGVNGIFLSANFNALCGGLSALFFVIGLISGMIVGNKSEMGISGDVVVAKRSTLPLILWAVSYAATQIFTTVVPTGGAGIGVVMMFLSAGAVVGMNTNMLRRYAKIRA